MMKEDQEGIKAQDWGCPRHPNEIFKESQASKLGDAQGIPFFINNYQVVSIETTFLLLYILCAILGASLCFTFSFVFVLLLVFTMLEPRILVWDRDTLQFFLQYLLSFTYIF